MREMRDSGIEWIGSIPNEWKIKRIKELFYEVNERSEKNDDYQLLSVSEYYGVAPKAEKVDEGDFLTHADSLEGYKICKPDDIVMNIMLAWKRALGVSRYEGIISPAYCIYRKRTNEIDTGYYHYLYRTDLYAGLFKQYSTGIIDSRLRLYPDKFLSLKCQMPELKEQKRMVEYLDSKCDQIDSIIAKQEQIIEKLKEYKLSVINEKTNVNIGVKCHLSYLGQMKNGLNFTDVDDGEKIMFLGVGDFKDYFVLDNKKMFSTITVNENVISEELMLENGDIIFVRSNGSKELVGRAVMVDGIDFKLTYTGFAIRYRNMRRDIINSKYLLYYFRSPDFRKLLEKNSQGSNISNMNQDLLGNIEISIPEMDYQNDTVCYLDEKCKVIDKTIEKKQETITKLLDYKKSLIYEVVTGKMEV